MIREFQITNFRCFEETTIGPLARVNLIAGRNGAGKTTLLEALFLHAGPNNPSLSLTINAFRTGRQGAGETGRAMATLFHDLKDKPIRLRSRGVRRAVRELTIRRLSARQIKTMEEHRPGPANGETPPSAIDSLTTAVGGTGLEFIWLEGKRRFRSEILTSPQGVQMAQTTRPTKLPVSIFETAQRRIGVDDVERYTSLERRGQHEFVLEALQLVQPKLKRLTVLVNDKEPMIYGDVGMAELLPLPMLGEGISRLLPIMAAIETAQNGALFIDEIETGLHHSVMLDVWKAIIAAAKRSRTQVFATTHSRECIEAAFEAAASMQRYELGLHRLERVGTRIEAITYDKESLQAALDADLEVR